METTNTAPEKAQEKTTAQRLEQAREEERRLHDIMEVERAAMEPYKQKFEKARSEWCKAYDYVRLIQQFKDEGLI